MWCHRRHLSHDVGIKAFVGLGLSVLTLTINLESHDESANREQEALMPFPNQSPRLFTKAGIEVLNPNQIGCYGIFREGVWIYVGRGDIRSQLMAHVNGDNPRITRENPTHYVTVVTTDDVQLEKALTLELKPVANQKVG
jgi:hypothetical protein